MNDDQRFISRRVRVFVGGAVAIVALAAAGVLGGIGFAKSPVSAPTTTTTTTTTGKIVICHHTHSKKHPQVTITVSQHAWKAHQRHGDTLGACTTTTTTGTTTTAPTTTTTTTATTTTSAPVKVHGNSGAHSHGHGH